ncbi:MAG: type 4a pilus biogenesis protein PilO [Heliobacteriaceae bacterium]|nr:type 4a pilus biogenesis protein PilO [Heliobacteriaceae bacterium]MDD4587185.1 type 4a pilus biogenesis protein PilO [Heliobacteriaceae bacterium]
MQKWWERRSWREKILLGAALGILVVIGGYKLLLARQIREYVQFPGILPASRDQLAMAQTKVTTYEQVESRWVQSQKNLAGVMSGFQAVIDPGALVVQIGEAAKQAKVNVKLFVPRAKVPRPANNPDLVELPVDLIVEGSYAGLIRFWASLEGLGANVIVRQFALTWEQNPVLLPEKNEAGEKGNGTVAKSAPTNPLLDLIAGLLGKQVEKITAGIGDDRGVAGKEPGELIRRLPRAKAATTVRGPTPTLNAGFTLAFFEVGKGGKPDGVDLSPYGAGRPDPFEPLFWDDKNVWLYPEEYFSGVVSAEVPGE